VGGWLGACSRLLLTPGGRILGTKPSVYDFRNSVILEIPFFTAARPEKKSTPPPGIPET
jgi:hypothetical protein